MAKLVTKFKYLKPGKKKKGGYARYIATREGVEKIDDSQKNEPATEKQQQFITKITVDYPEVKELLEYEDYTLKPTVENASELISRAMEQVADDILDSKTYADYIATRPRAQRFGAHGLFSDDGKPVNLRKVSHELNLHEGNVWTAIISLRREDAERLGYDSGERWRDMLRAHTQEFSEQFHIPMENLRWFAAFHNESYHPHVHMIIYSTDTSAGYLSKNNVNNLRSSLGKEIFAQDLVCKYKEQTAHRDSLRTESKELVANIIAQINQGNYDNPVLETKLLELSKKLSETGGKKVYGYLNADTKALVDEIVDELAGDERLSQLYELWYQDKVFIRSTYTDEPAERVPLSQNNEFKPIRNAVIREALNIFEDRFTVEDENEVVASETESIHIPLDDSDEEEPSQPRFSEFERLKRKAKAGNMYSQYALAKLLLNNDSENYDPESAVDWLKKSSERGNSVAKYRLGKLFLLGEDVPQDTGEALRWLNSASDDGYEYAQYLLGKLYAEGTVVEKDVFMALLYLERAALENNPYAAYLAGKLRLTDAENRDTHRAVEHFTTAAENGNSYAEYMLGKMYLYGNGVEKDTDLALSYLNLSAEHGNPYAPQLLYNLSHSKNPTVAMAAFRLLQHLARIIQNRIEDERKSRENMTDKKLRRIIDAKREAHGLKHG
ncbi:MobP3 family relaxase [Ruminococcus sp. JL13D9]|uniref:MobP3 family relaxase n=1 Tax=Ruminococcus sp. JL13D9 TaxID=3233381 RepID=UPI00389A817F